MGQMLKKQKDGLELALARGFACYLPPDANPAPSVPAEVLLHCLDDGPHLLRNKDVGLLLRNILSRFDPKTPRGF